MEDVAAFVVANDDVPLIALTAGVNGSALAFDLDRGLAVFVANNEVARIILDPQVESGRLRVKRNARRRWMRIELRSGGRRRVELKDAVRPIAADRYPSKAVQVNAILPFRRQKDNRSVF